MLQKVAESGGLGLKHRGSRKRISVSFRQFWPIWTVLSVPGSSGTGHSAA